MSFASYSFAFQEINNSIYFPRVAQGHGSCSGAPNPQFTQNNSAKITGTGGQALAFCSSNLGAGLPSDGCDGQQCVVTGSLSTPSLSLTGPNSFPIWNSNETIECSTTQSTSINTLNQVNLTSGCELTFLPNNNGYRIKNFQLNQNAKAILSSGDYWFESANFVQNSQLVIDGDVRIFILGNTQISGSQLNATSTGNLTIVAYGSISFNNQSIVNGYIYAADQLTLNNNSVLNGRVTAKQLTMSGSSRINQFEQQGYTCFSDDFNRSSLGQSWVPFTSSGNFTPRIVSDRLRLTEDIGNQATAVTYQRIFPADGNLVQVELDYYAWADLTGNGADGISLIFSDASVTPRTGGFGGSLGYAPRNPTSTTPAVSGFAGGWLGIGLDEWGNYSNPTEGRQGGPGFREQAVAIRGSESANYQYLVGTDANLNPKLDVRRTCQWWGGGCSFPGAGPGHRYFITIDSRSGGAVWVRVDRSVNGTMQTIIDWYNVLSNPNQGATPVDFLLSLAGSTGASVNHHEIDNFRVCALKSREVGEQVDHFRFTLPSSDALTCNAADVQIQACANSSCSELYQQPVSVNLSPNASPSASGGWVNGPQINFSNGIANLKLRRNTPGSVTVGVQNSTPTAKPFSTNLCRYGTGDYSAQNCSLVFSDSGFIIDVPHAYANQLVTGTITALSKGDNPEQCIPSFAGVDKDVSLWSEYLTPSGGQGFSAMNVVVDDLPISNNSAAPSHRSLYFDENGQAEFELTYREAGSLALHARFNGSGDEQDLQLTGQANFIRVPRALVLSTNHSYNSAHPDGKCPAADLSCLVFARAGEGFNLNIKAVAAEPNEDNDFTNNLGVINYQQQSIILNHTLVEPSNGSAGSIGTLNYDHEFGEVTTVQQSVSEVGVFYFSLVPPTSYLGLNLIEADLPIAVTSTGPIGRFIPAYFAVSPMTVTLTSACSTEGQPFTYLGQPFAYANNPGLYLQPKSGSGSDTLNYLIGDWWRYNNQWAERAYHHAVDDNDFPIDFTNELIAPVSRQSPSTSGVILMGEKLRYQKPIDPMVPFNADFNLQLSINDLRDSDDVCYRTSYSEDCLGYTFENIDQTMPLYWGRLTIEDVFGPETQGLQQKIISEYYTSDGFVTNTHDNCTELPQLSVFEFQSNDFSVNQAGSKPPVTVTMQPDTSPLTLEQGMKRLDYTAPGVSNRGVIKALLNLEQHGLPWLRRYNSQSETWDDSVSGQVQFGLYRGNDRVIWWRELN
ncbi:MSHA biogenesis protein MshQ [Vibrio sp. V26_P1S5P106]|nr:MULTISPECIES: DUF6701 domain-containing protein [Vibrio]NAW70255.1 MSHA biogenesis protein MshQ [Vibrio sp. V28_P6S34P95]NAX03783.1 MSHA biogenesis protein MshQ [Vibrio sp. V30_P3S12P165]NAX39148.1 MSHA biogenesis protein MshQ [Vibrio sp. V26_P1S5P106]